VKRANADKNEIADETMSSDAVYQVTHPACPSQPKTNE
jgi:hypothetical protein